MCRQHEEREAKAEEVVAQSSPASIPLGYELRPGTDHARQQEENADIRRQDTQGSCHLDLQHLSAWGMCFDANRALTEMSQKTGARLMASLRQMMPLIWRVLINRCQWSSGRLTSRFRFAMITQIPREIGPELPCSTCQQSGAMLQIAATALKTIQG